MTDNGMTGTIGAMPHGVDQWRNRYLILKSALLALEHYNDPLVREIVGMALSAPLGAVPTSPLLNGRTDD